MAEKRDLRSHASAHNERLEIGPVRTTAGEDEPGIRVSGRMDEIGEPFDKKIEALPVHQSPSADDGERCCCEVLLADDDVGIGNPDVHDRAGLTTVARGYPLE